MLAAAHALRELKDPACYEVYYAILTGQCKSSEGFLELLETYQFLFRDAKLALRKDAPSLEERIQQARDEIKSEGWDESKPEKPLELP